MAQDITGFVFNEEGQPMGEVTVFMDGTSKKAITDHRGYFTFEELEKGSYRLVAFLPGYKEQYKDVGLGDSLVSLTFKLKELEQALESVVIQDSRSEELGMNWLQSVSGAAIYEAKKTELILLDELIANKAANVSRQIYSRVPGLNIWENDGAGVQLGIGGRGLSPNRTSNFNVRQNGYDISADALGYPESYYTPPTQALERIEIVRGAAGLQYGTQFGGMLNFKFKEGPLNKKIEVNSTNTLGSFGLFNTFNSLGGTVGKINYYGFYQYKRSDGWRPHSGIDQHNAYGAITYNFSPFLSLKLEHTHMSYLAQQPGGLTDVEFYQDPRQSKRSRNWFEVGWDLSAAEFNYRLSKNVKFNNRTFHLSANRYAVGNLGSIARVDDPSENRNLLKDQYNNWGNEFRTIIHYPLFGQKSVFLIGNRVYFGKTLRSQGEANSDDTPNFDFINPEEPDDSKFSFPGQNVSFFAENIFNLTPKLSITPGVRYEYIDTKSAGYYYNEQLDIAGNTISNEKIEEYRQRPRSFVLFGMGVSYKAFALLESYANFSQNFRAINFNDIRVDNPSLTVDEHITDEQGYNIDLGIRGASPGSFRYDMSIFFLSYRDRIGNIFRTVRDPRFAFDSIPKTERYRTNVGDASIFGLETYLEGNIFKIFNFDSERSSLKGFINFAVLRAKYLTNNESGIAGNNVELVPPINLKTGLTYRLDNFGLSYMFSYVKRHFSDATNTNRWVSSAVEGPIPSYSVMDLSFSYQLEHWNFEAGVNNLLNNYYFTRRAAGYPGPGIIPSDGRSGYVSVGIHF